MTVGEPQFTKTWPGTYTASDLASSSVDSAELVDGAIDTEHFAASCITATAIADGVVTNAHLGTDAVQFEKLEKAYVAKATTAVLSSTGTTTKAVTFGETFAAAPIVVANAQDSSGTTCQIGVGDVTTTGANLYITDASDTSVTVTVAFFACEG